jgi:hypothetical protein
VAGLRPVTELAHEHAAVIASLDLVTHKVGGGDVEYVHRIRLRGSGQSPKRIALEAERAEVRQRRRFGRRIPGTGDR